MLTPMLAKVFHSHLRIARSHEPGSYDAMNGSAGVQLDRSWKVDNSPRTRRPTTSKSSRDILL